MTILGLAVLGKANEPLYLCDCQMEAHQQASSPPSAAPADPFGFVEAANALGPARSMSLDHQFLVHSALDILEEKLGKTKPDGSMPLRRVVDDDISPPIARFTGPLFQEEDLAVYGHVTATNIKLLALCHRQQCKETHVKDLLAKLHLYYIEYVLNPIASVETYEKGIIQSPMFDKNVRIAVREYVIVSASVKKAI
jgi:Sedlin, N-terminal conserved region